MTSDKNLMLCAKLAGFRLVVLANSLGCDTSFSYELHHRLVEGLDGETEIFRRFVINVLDEIEIDHDTYDPDRNGGPSSLPSLRSGPICAKGRCHRTGWVRSTGHSSGPYSSRHPRVRHRSGKIAKS